MDKRISLTPQKVLIRMAYDEIHKLSHEINNELELDYDHFEHIDNTISKVKKLLIGALSK